MYAPSVCSSDSFCGKGKWYLPALGELYSIQNNLVIITSALSKIPNGKKLYDDHYWSSTEYDYIGAWLLQFNTGHYTFDGKWNNIHPLRPVLQF